MQLQKHWTEQQAEEQLKGLLQVEGSVAVQAEQVPVWVLPAPALSA